MTSNPWGRCPCGHLWLVHDVDEYAGDGSETCCAEGCEQVGCPGARATRSVADMLEEMAPDLLRINPAAAETAAVIMVRLRS